jgi:ABC-type lipoprotein export system ATPase subunit
LVKIYKVADLETVALQGLDLEVRLGEILGVVGNSGSGKTTLVNIIGGLDRPSAGRIYVGGQNLLEFADAELSRYRREKMGFVWQQSGRNQIPYLTALENVQVPMIVAGLRREHRQKQAVRLLAAVGLGERMHHRPAEMSGGEQQRVAIAVAMANNPEILLADEPTGEVDEVNALVHQFPAPRERGIRPPFPLVARTPAVPVAAAHEHHRTQRAGIENLPRLLQRAMEAMVEAHAHQHAGRRGAACHPIQLGGTPRARLLRQHVLSRRGCARRNRSQLIVRSRHYHDIRATYGLLPRASRRAAGKLRRQRLGALANHVATRHQPRAGQRTRAPRADEPASNYGYRRC